MIDLKNICDQAISLVKETAKFIRKEHKDFTRDKIEVKGFHDFVSYVDKTAEEKLVQGLEQILPEAGFIAEEGTRTHRSEKYNWVIDPLDGTTNFIHGITPFSISVALMDEEEVVIGIVMEVGLDECFWAIKNQGAFLNDQAISVNQTSSTKEALIATGFPYNNFDRLEPFLASLEYFIRNSHGVRRLGSAATDLAYVACGRFGAFYEYGLNPWDVAAGSLLVKEAGGIVSDYKAEKNYIFGREIIASNKALNSEFTQIVKKYMHE